MRATKLTAAAVAAAMAASVLTAGPLSAQAADLVGLNGAPCAYASIGDAMLDATAGDTVAVAAGTYNETLGFIDFDLSIVAADASCTPTQTGDPSTVVIDGGGSGATNGGHVEIANATLTLQDLTLRNTQAEASGGIAYVDGGVLELTDVELSGGVADVDGGAIAAVNDGSVVMNGGFLTDNEAGSDGGAIFMDGGLLIVDSSKFVGASSPADPVPEARAERGGLLFLRGGVAATVDASSLTDGVAGSSGGATHIEGSGSEIVFDQVEFSTNNAHDGGSLAIVDGADVRVVTSSFSGDTATDGGSILVQAAGNGPGGTWLEVVNSVLECGPGMAFGCVRGTGPVTIDIAGSSVAQYRGISDGAVFVSDGVTLDITDSTISDNYTFASGSSGLTVVGSTAVLLRTVMERNTFSEFGGGAIGAWSSSLSVVQSSIIDNQGWFVGGIAASSSVVRLVDSVVARNDGLGTGGISVAGVGLLNVESSTIAGNRIVDDFFVDGEPLIGPSVTVRGGAIWTGPDTTVDIDNTIVWDNESDAPVVQVEPGIATWRASDVQGSGGSASWDSALGTDGGQNLDVDPSLDPTWTPDVASPIRDAGNAALLPTDFFDVDGDADVVEQLPDDFLSRTRVRGAGLDMGAVERPDRAFVLSNRPCGMYDTSSATGTLNGPLDGGEIRTLQVTGPLPASQGFPNNCVADGADAVLFHVQADPINEGNLRLSAANVAPNGGVVNYGLAEAGSDPLRNTNVVPSELSNGGFVDLGANGGTAGSGLPSAEVTMHTVGYFIDDVPAGRTGLDVFPLPPCAILDSRENQGAAGSFLGPFSSFTQLSTDVVGAYPVGQGGGNTSCGVPAGAEGVIVNLVAINSTGFGYVGAVRDPATIKFGAVNWAGLPANNAVSLVVPVASDGTISVTVDPFLGASHVRAVVLGYVDDQPGLQFNPLPPCAAFDSRSTVGASGSFAGLRTAGTSTTYQIAGSAVPAAQGGNNSGDCGVPDGTEFVSINLVAIGAAAPGNLRADATGSTPTGGVLNFAPLDPALANSNAVTIPLDELGRMDVFANGGPAPVGTPLTNVRGVILGYFD